MKREFISLLRPNSEQLRSAREGRSRIPAPGMWRDHRALFRETAKIRSSLQNKPQNICERVKPLQFSVSLNPELGKYIIMEFWNGLGWKGP